MTAERSVRQSLVLKSRLSEMREACSRILSDIKANNFDCDDIFAIHLAIEEALVNAIRHGNKLDASKNVTIEYTATPDCFEITVTDEGPGFSPESVPDPRMNGNLYKASGRGLLLMQSYMNKVEYNKAGNSVYMVKLRTPESGECGSR